MRAGIKLAAEKQGHGARADKGDAVVFESAATLNKGGVLHTRRTFHGVLGARRLIAGVEYALLGMREGGYRKVRISPHLAYRDRGVPCGVPKNALVVYELWLTAVRKRDA